MITRDIPRWTDSSAEAPEELRTLLRAGRAAAGSIDEVAELRQRLALALGPASGLGGDEPPAGAGPAPAAPDAAGDVPSADVPSGALPLRRAGLLGRGLGRRGWGVLGGACLGLGVWVYAARSPAPPAVDSAAPGSAAPERGAPAQPPEATPRVEPLPVQQPSVHQPPAPAVVVPRDERQPEKTVASRRATEPRGAARKVSRPSSTGEAALLERARDALGKDPARALALTREHEQRFARGVLAQEREVIAIEALKQLGRERAANARAAEFERRYRGSVHQPRLEGTGAPR